MCFLGVTAGPSMATLNMCMGGIKQQTHTRCSVILTIKLVNTVSHIKALIRGYSRAKESITGEKGGKYYDCL